MIHLFFSFLFLVHPIYISSTNVVINDDKLEVKLNYSGMILRMD